MSRNKHILIFGLISILIPFLWIKSAYFLAGGEESLFLYDPLRTLHLFSSAWYGTGTGFPIPVLIPRVTLLIAGYLFEFLFGMKTAQYIIFSFLIFSGLSGFYIYANFLSKVPKTSFLASLFYLFNLYVLTQVWGRFLYPGFFIWAYLPIFSFLAIRLIMSPNWKIALLLAVSTFIFSDTFGQPIDIITIWTPTVLYLVFETIKNIKNKTNIFRIILRFSVVVLYWLLISFWWLYPNFLIGKNSFNQILNWKTNFDSLRGVSQYFDTLQVVVLRQKFIFGEGSRFFSYYSQPSIYFLSVAVFVVTIIGWWISKKNKIWPYLSGLALVGWFISKGTNPPFGNIFFEFLFKNFQFTQAYRNSYEKFGLIWVLPYSIFFAFGTNSLVEKLSLKIRQYAVIAILILVCGILVLPMWSGDVFASSLRINVPEYYNQTNDYLNSLKSDGRVLMLPMLPGDGVRYLWGYQGVEPSEFLFDRPAVSKILRATYFDDKYLDLYRKITSGGNFERDLEEMNIRYLLVHGDIDATASGASSSAQVKSILIKNKDIRLINTIGALDIYEYASTGNQSLFGAEGKNIPRISYVKINNTHYVVSVKKANGPFRLVFKETYSPLWTAKVDNIVLDDHSLVYDYANEWLVDRVGDYNIEVIFKTLPWQ